MRTGLFPTVHVLVATTRCQYQWEWGVGPQVNKFEQVSSDDHQMSVVERWRGRSQVWWGRGQSYHVTYSTYDACDIPTPSP